MADNTLIARLDALPLNERQGSKIISVIRTSLTEQPELIEEITPGKRLAPKRMSVKDRVALASAAASQASKAAADLRHEKVIPIIEEVLRKDPNASLAEIKTVLDKSGLTPARADRWSRATINVIIAKAGLRAKD